jgi:hypothetical protein
MINSRSISIFSMFAIFTSSSTQAQSEIKYPLVRLLTGNVTKTTSGNEAAGAARISKSGVTCLSDIVKTNNLLHNFNDFMAFFLDLNISQKKNPKITRYLFLLNSQNNNLKSEYS